MDLHDTPKQYRSIGEKTPLWVICSLTVLGILGCVAAVWLIATELPLKTMFSWKAEVSQSTTKPVPEAHPSTVAEPPQPPEDSAMMSKAGQGTEEATPPAHTSTVTEPLQPPEDSAAKEQAKEVARIQPSTNVVPDCPLLFTFTFASESVSPQGPPDLQDKVMHLRDWLNAHPQAKLLIEGHTDTWGDKQFNLQLSSRRAKAVAALLAEAGVPQKQLFTRALGADRPLQGNRSGSRKNRRVSLRVENAQGCPETATEGDTP